MSRRQFTILCRRHRAAEQVLDRRTAVLATVVANTVPRQRGSRWSKVADFMPGRRTEKTPDQLLAVVEQLNAQLGGNDQRRGTGR